MRALASLIVLFAAEAAAAPPTDDWSWLAGDWIQCSDEGVVEERWIGPRDGLLVGVNLSASGDKATFEHLRIARSDGGWTYWASPMGRPAVPFALAERGPQSAAFENPAHGFPSRIVYRRDGAELVARIEGTAGNRHAAKEWRFRQEPAGEHCR